MKTFVMLCALAIASAPAIAQRPDSVARADSIRRDSLARDSILLARELERIGGERVRTTLPPGMSAERAPQGPANPSLLPNISAIGDFVLDASPDGSTQEDERRALIREVEVGIQAAVDPYFRADFFLGFHPEAVEVEEAYLSTLSLPWSSQIRVGQFLLPIGKQNTTHRAELHTLEYSWAAQEFLGAEGLKGTGLYASKIFSPLGFYQEIQLAAVERFPAAEDAHGAEAEPEPVLAEPVNRSLSGAGYVGRFRNYWDLSPNANVELSASFGTGKRAAHIVCTDATPAEVECPGAVTAAPARQTIVGADFTYRWRPLGRGLYRSFILQAEWMRQMNDDAELPEAPAGIDVAEEEPADNYNGAYLFARYQLTRRFYVGGRYDWLEQPEAAGETFTAASGYLTFFPSEFSKMVFAVERLMPPGDADPITRLVLQATFAVGPHRPHPF